MVIKNYFLHSGGNINTPCFFFPREEVVRSVGVQRERFELAGPTKTKARECCDLVILSLYVFIPPSRSLEIRTLEIVKDSDSLDQRQFTDRNLLVIKDDRVLLHFQNYKTKRFSGRDELTLEVRLIDPVSGWKILQIVSFHV